MPVFRPSTRLPNRWVSRPAELRALALEPVRLNYGTLYPCSGSQLHDTITHNTRPRRSSEYVSADKASREIQTHNTLGRNLSQGEYDAIRRLESLVITCMSGRISWTPDLIIKAFCDIDRVFFLGLLRGHVHVEWTPASSFAPAPSGRTRFAKTTPLGGGKARIRLNAHAILGSVGFPPFKVMWRVMLHEMCHAYEITQVARQNWDRNKHGRHFGTKVLAVHRRALEEIHVGAMDSDEVYGSYSYPPRRR